GTNHAAIADAIHADQIWNPSVILRTCQHEHGPDLRHRFHDDGGRNHEKAIPLLREIGLAVRDVLDPDNSFVGRELDDPINQQQRIPMRKNPTDWGNLDQSSASGGYGTRSPRMD